MNITSKMNNRDDIEIPVKSIILGNIGSCYGIRGWLRIFSFTEEIENIFNYQPWFIQKNDKWRKIKLEDWCYHNQNIIIKLKAINNRNAANLLTNHEIVIDSSQLSSLEDNYYWKDIIGCQVITTKGYNLGKVINIMGTRSNDVLIIKANLKDMFNIKERLVPFLNRQVIKKVDLTTQTIEVDWDPSF